MRDPRLGFSSLTQWRTGKPRSGRACTVWSRAKGGKGRPVRSTESGRVNLALIVASAGGSRAEEWGWDM